MYGTNYSSLVGLLFEKSVLEQWENLNKTEKYFQ